MKRTTYILLGILISSLVVIITGMYYFSLTGGERMNRGIAFPTTCKKVDLAGIRVVKIYSTQAEVNSPKKVIALGSLSVAYADESVKSSISFPDTKYLHVTQKGDTLLLDFDLSSSDLPEQAKDDESLFITDVHLNLVVDSTLAYISNDLFSLDIISKGVSLDSLTVRSHSLVQLDSCDVRALDVAGYDVRFEANNSRIRDFFLDLDGIQSWNFNQCTADTGHLTGSRRCNLKEKQCRQVFWTPKGEDAKLVVTFAQKASMLIRE